MERDKQIEQYLDLKFDIFPTRGGQDEHESKAPLEGIKWQPRVRYKGKELTRPEMADLFRNNPKCNIAILTGDRSNITAIDIDTHQDIEQGKKVLASIDLPGDTATVKTGRGLHFYFKTSGHIANSTKKDYRIQGNGRYVIAPPSIHWQGQAYTFLPGRGLDVIQPATFPDTVTGPVTLPVTLQGPDTNTPGRTAGAQGKVVRIPGRGMGILDNIPSFVMGNTFRPDCIRQLWEYPLQVGERHDGLFLLFNLMVSNGRDRPDYIFEKYIKLKNSKLDKPYTEGELRATLQSDKIHRHSCDTIKKAFDFIKCGDCKYPDIRGGQAMVGNEGKKLLWEGSIYEARAWVLIQRGEIDPNDIGPGKRISWVNFAEMIKAGDYRTAKKVYNTLQAKGLLGDPALPFPGYKAIRKAK